MDITQEEIDQTKLELLHKIHKATAISLKLLNNEIVKKAIERNQLISNEETENK